MPAAAAAAERVAKNGQICAKNLVELSTHCKADDDDKSAPENVPPSTDANVGVPIDEWGHSDICPRRRGWRRKCKSLSQNFLQTLFQRFCNYLS